MPEIFPLHRLVAAFSDGTRAYFDGPTESAARAAMEAAQARHGDITWFDGVTDLHYDGGLYYAARPEPPEIAVFDFTDKENPK